MENVAEIELCIRIKKERWCALASDLPFNFLHKTIVIILIYFLYSFAECIPHEKMKFSKNSTPIHHGTNQDELEKALPH